MFEVLVSAGRSNQEEQVQRENRVENCYE